MPSGRFLAAVAAVAACAVLLALWLYPSSSDFAATNPYWHGTRATRAMLGVRGLASLAELPEPQGTALIVIPAVLPHADDIVRLDRYLAGGGVLILMDDFGYGNTVLAHLGIAARFQGTLLVDPLFNYRNPRLPRIADAAAQPAAGSLQTLVLNRATALSGTDGMTVLAWSSPLSYLDADGNGARGPDEAGGPFPVAAAVAKGAGVLVLVADPSLLINSMVEVGGNKAFLRYLFQFAGERAQVYLDEAHLPRAPLDLAKAWIARTRALVGHPVLAYALAAGSLALPLVILLKGHGGRS
ncbi:MAG: DUF4350 domain-containing protein [Armatimonadota bacterium]|nr:DUF4350 domain-containing protein [Armatimonadota bacterium]MDR7475801.1 DUF4350 domain-containing protein [Armatimonadota bacterium]